jgi:hypothetical protein
MLVVSIKNNQHILIWRCVLNDASLQKITPPNGSALPFTSGSIFTNSIFLYALTIFQDFGAVVIVIFPKIL